jgi:hypothetical protein
MSTSAAATRPVRSIRPPGLKRLLARICGCEESEFVLQVVQPSLVGMIDGTVSTLAPIFAAAVSSSSSFARLQQRMQIGDPFRGCSAKPAAYDGGQSSGACGRRARSTRVSVSHGAGLPAA